MGPKGAYGLERPLPPSAVSTGKWTPIKMGVHFGGHDSGKYDSKAARNGLIGHFVGLYSPNRGISR